MDRFGRDTVEVTTSGQYTPAETLSALTARAEKYGTVIADEIEIRSSAYTGNSYDGVGKFIIVKRRDEEEV